MTEVLQELTTLYKAALQNCLFAPDLARENGDRFHQHIEQAGVGQTAVIAMLKQILPETLGDCQTVAECVQVTTWAIEFLEQGLLNSQSDRQQLPQEEQKFKALVENVPDIISRVDREFRFQYINPSVERETGIPVCDWIGKTEQDLGYPEDIVSSWHTVVQQVFETGQEICYEAEFPVLDGMKYWWCRIVPEFENGTVQSALTISRDITHLKKIELELRQQRDLREAIFHESTDAIFLVNAQTLLIEDCNQRAVELFEADDREDLLGIEGHTLQRYPLTATEVSEIVRDMQAKGFWSQEVEYITLKSKQFWGNLAAKPISVAGQTLHFVRVTDITECKQVEAALRDSELRLQAILDSAPFSIFMKDRQGYYLLTNPAYKALMSKEQAELLGKTDYDILPVEVADHCWASDQLVLQKGEPITFEEIIPVTGEQRTWLITKFALSTNAIQSPAVCGIAIDITDRQQAEEALRQSEKKHKAAEQALQQLNQELEQRVQQRTEALERSRTELQQSEEKFRQLAENIESVFWMRDADNQLLYVSPSYKQMWGSSVQSLYQHPIGWLEAIHPDDQPRMIELTSVMFLNGYDETYRIIRSDGAMRWIRDRAFVIRNEQGEVYRIAGIAEDISAQKQAEAQTQTSLKEKEILLKEIHHRVKNNLQIVSALLSFQAESVEDPQILAALQDSENRLQAMSLIHEILYLSEDLGQLNFSTYIQRLADSILMANRGHTNRVELIYKLDPVFLNLETAIPCGLLLNELITNAIKHAFPNGQQGTICIRLRQLPPVPQHSPTSKSHPNWVLYEPHSQPVFPLYTLSIEDNGIGIPETFDFKQLKSLGLRITCDLAQQLRGKLELDCSYGTRFQITFSELKYRKRF